MRSAEEWALSVAFVHADDLDMAAIIRSAQREAAEWMREEAARLCDELGENSGDNWFAQKIRSIKLPGDEA